MNIVCLKAENPASVQDRLLREFGWRVSITRDPESVRLVIMPHLNDEILSEFLTDLNSLA
jgi:tyrosine decarboxylase/aspartate 1-decarboxylase